MSEHENHCVFVDANDTELNDMPYARHPGMTGWLVVDLCPVMAERMGIDTDTATTVEDGEDHDQDGIGPGLPVSMRAAAL